VTVETNWTTRTPY